MALHSKRPVPIPPGVTVEVLPGRELRVSGSLGALRRPLPPDLTVEVLEQGVLVHYVPGGRRAKTIEGTWKAHLTNMVKGVQEGFFKRLVIEGVGYRVRQEGDALVFELGFSHLVRFQLPRGIQVKVEKEVLTITGLDPELLGITAAKIRSLRPPDAYKGKGIRYEGEVLRLKPGKRAVGTV